jgi:hypothetical protein
MNELNAKAALTLCPLTIGQLARGWYQEYEAPERAAREMVRRLQEANLAETKVVMVPVNIVAGPPLLDKMPGDSVDHEELIAIERILRNRWRGPTVARTFVLAKHPLVVRYGGADQSIRSSDAGHAMMIGEVFLSFSPADRQRFMGEQQLKSWWRGSVLPDGWLKTGTAIEIGGRYRLARLQALAEAFKNINWRLY